VETVMIPMVTVPGASFLCSDTPNFRPRYQTKIK
jgi:hypothetical protein